jgi:membrane fusion protein (multidrug efflux system)
MKTKYIVLIILIAIIAVVAFRLSSNKKIIDEKNKPASTREVRIPVKIAKAGSRLVEITINKTGNLTPFKEVKALAGTGGNLLQVRFNRGDRVNEGQILAVTDMRAQQLELQKAETSAAKLRGDLDTCTELLQGKAATQQQVNNIRQDYTAAVNQVAQARKTLTDAYIRAPTSGIIAAKAAEQGVYVNAGAEIATIVNLSKAKVQVNLTETEVYQVTQGQQVNITTDVYPGQVFHGRVSFISPQADAAHNYLTEIQIDNAGKAVLRSGTFVYADFSKKTSQTVLVIPREALTESVRNASVYVVENGRASLRKIQTGTEMGSQIAVISGLKEGDQVVTSGQINLKDGSQVSISK